MAFTRALACDPVSAYGGVVASNRVVDENMVSAMGSLFVECIIAPGYSQGARELLAKRKNCRLVEAESMQITPDYELRSVNGGVLKQSVDQGDPADTEWKVVSQRQPTPAEWQALRFAWKACQHVKSNAIVFARGEATVGMGGGQPNRVDLCAWPYSAPVRTLKGRSWHPTRFSPLAIRSRLPPRPALQPWYSRVVRSATRRAWTPPMRPTWPWCLPVPVISPLDFCERMNRFQDE